jgi:hypothetical protein
VGQVIRLRIERLEAAAAPVNDLSGVGDAELTARLIELEQEIIDDPKATLAQKERALKIMHFPWGRGYAEWTEADRNFFHELSEALRWRR